ncbi:MAG: D-glycero-beta-D-manno-heptose-7-phosphate kinase [Candidatus Aenigmatarchaeota archaeon]
MHELIKFINEFENKRILIIGDVMLDRYVFGSIERISSEAPIPIVSTNSEQSSLGGAANVAKNVRVLCNNVFLAGVIGNDEAGVEVKNLLVKAGINKEAVIFDHKRHTTVKTRLIAQHQQLMRIDKEKIEPLESDIESKLYGVVADIIPTIDAIILSDYAKGVLTPSLCQSIIKKSKECSKPIIVDPKNDFSKFSEATILKPNLKELFAITKTNDEKTAVDVAFKNSNPQAIIVTKGKDGMTVYSNDNITDIKTMADEVYDVTGAGDTVSSLLTLAVASGANFVEAARIANCGAAIVVKKLGAASVSKEELLSMMDTARNNKVKTREEIEKLVEQLKHDEKIVVSTNGSFDLLHAGHVHFLKEAKKQGDILIVGLNSDSSVRAWKQSIGYKDWEKRPIIPQQQRAEMLAALECVDYITVFEEPECFAFVESIKPNIHVNGSEYGTDCIEAPIVRKYGGRVHVVEKIPGLSTSDILKKIKESE